MIYLTLSIGISTKGAIRNLTCSCMLHYTTVQNELFVDEQDCILHSIHVVPLSLGSKSASKGERYCIFLS